MKKKQIITEIWMIRDYLQCNKYSGDPYIVVIEKCLEDLDNLLHYLPYKDKWFRKVKRYMKND